MVERPEYADRPEGDQERIEPGETGSGDEIAALRAILVGPERRELEALQARLDDLNVRASEVGAVIPRVFQRHANDPSLARALAPSLERAITKSVQRNPKPLADALFPVMGPAIRKAVAASLAGMIESLNRTLEHAFSRQSLRWRFEALRTGKTFAEVVLLKTLLFRVEQVMLIDRKTGLLLQHAHAGMEGAKDADMVSGMLTAIRDFAQDSFRMSGDDSLESLKVGDLAVWVEAGPHAILAAVIRGSAPRDVRRVLQDTLELIHLEFGEALESFSGDARALDGSLAALEQCMRAEYKSEPRHARSWKAWAAATAVVLLLLTWAVMSYRTRAREARYLDALRAAPGITVVSATHENGKLVVSGLRDPSAADPGALLAGTGLDPDDVTGRWSPYYSLDPEFVRARAHQALRPPAGTSLVLKGTVLSATGTPPLAWLTEAMRFAPLIPGVTAFDTAGALDATMRGVISGLEQRTVLFDKGTTTVSAGQEDVLRRVVQGVGELEALAAAVGQRFRLDITGHADEDGPAESNVPLSRARAAVVQSMISRAVPGRLEMAVVAFGSSQPVVLSQNEEDKHRNRRVTIQVVRVGG